MSKGRRTASGLFLLLLLWTGLGVRSWAAPPLQRGQTLHWVQPGETLSAIAERYNVTVEAIAAANGLLDPDQIAAGQRLFIPGANGPKPAAPYTVQPGDTLFLIARRHNVSVGQMAQLNLLTNPSLIHIGQELLIPAEETRPLGGIVHVVQAGDTMASIAAHHGLTVWRLAQANDITNPNVIHVGQRLLIPGTAGQSSLSSPFVALQIVPAVIGQGMTGQVLVQTDGEVMLSGSYNGDPLVFVGVSGEYRALFGVSAMATPGPYPLDLKAVQGARTVSLRCMVQVAEGAFGVQYLAFSSDKEALLDPALVREEAARVWDVTTQVTLPGLWQRPFALPLADEPVVTAPFGIRRSYGGGVPTSYHSGVDYGVGAGTPIYSPAPGRIVLAEPLAVRGSAVIVDHGRGVMSGFWHLSQIHVSLGAIVAPGEILGLVGNTGLSTGAHLHWEVRVNGIPVDPVQWTREHLQ